MIVHSGILSSASIALAACICALALGRRRLAYFGRIGTILDDRANVLLRRTNAEYATMLTLLLLVGIFFSHLRLIATSNAIPGALGQRSATFALDVLASIALYVLYHTMGASRFPMSVRSALVVAAAAMYGAAVTTEHIRSADLFAYVAYAKLGWASYAPSNAPFTGRFAIMNGAIAAAWKRLEPSPYGPLSLGIDWLLVASARSFEQARIALRLLNVVAIGVSLLALRRLGFRAPILAVVGLDPEMVLNFVADGHNDILPVAMILAGLAAFRRGRSAAIVLAVCAGAVKIPYVVPALLVAYSDESVARRLRVAALIIVGTVFASAIGGQAYLHGLEWQIMHGSASARGESLPHELVHGVALLAALVAVATALGFRQTFWPAAFLFPQLFGAGYPWYAIAGLPYAVVTRKGCAAFVILLPLWFYIYRVSNSFG